MNQTIDAQELYRSSEEAKIRTDFADHFQRCPIPKEDLLHNLGLFLSSKNLARILFMNDIYKQIVGSHGVVMEFGTRWGQNLSLFSALRGIYEPFNRHRKIIGFDTFTGFPSISKEDVSGNPIVHEGGLSCSEDYEEYLEQVMVYQERDNPVSHIKKFEIVKGDASIELPKYLEKNPETIVSLAYFDFDLYAPTLKCLSLIRDRLTKGAIVAFDELCDHDFPGETLALKEVFGLNCIKLQRNSHCSRTSYFVVE